MIRKCKSHYYTDIDFMSSDILHKNDKNWSIKLRDKIFLYIQRTDKVKNII